MQLLTQKQQTNSFMRKSFLFILSALLILTSCAPRIYQDPQAYSIAQSHKIIAILPPNVAINAKRSIEAEAQKEQQRTESLNFQKEMYSWLLHRKTQGKLSVEIQDIETTNALLRKINQEDLLTMTPTEMGKVLKVDGIVKSNFSISNPMSPGAAIAAAVLIGVIGNTDKTTADLSLYDVNTEKMIWNYNHKASGRFTNAGSLVDQLMKNASKKFPHIKR